MTYRVAPVGSGVASKGDTWVPARVAAVSMSLAAPPVPVVVVVVVMPPIPPVLPVVVVVIESTSSYVVMPPVPPVFVDEPPPQPCAAATASVPSATVIGPARCQNSLSLASVMLPPMVQGFRLA